MSKSNERNGGRDIMSDYMDDYNFERAREKLYGVVDALDKVLALGDKVLRDAALFHVPGYIRPDFDAHADDMDVKPLRAEYVADLKEAYRKRFGIATASELEAELRHVQVLLSGVLLGPASNPDITELKAIYDTRMDMDSSDIRDCVRKSDEEMLSQVDLDGDDVICGSWGDGEC